MYIVQAEVSPQTFPLRIIPEIQLLQSSALEPQVSQGELHKEHVAPFNHHIPSKQDKQSSASDPQVLHGKLQSSHVLVSRFKK
jgi:hypothetical protein